MLNAGEKLLNLWRARKGLIVLLLAGGLICLLAAVAPQAWATPDQKPLAQSITEFNDNPDPPECIWVCDGPMMIGYHGDPIPDPTGGLLTDPIDVYVTENTAWIIDDTTVADPPGTVFVHHQTTVQVTNGAFDPNPAMIWDPPEPGYYDVFFDVDLNELFNDGDGIMGPDEPDPGDPEWVGAGICVVPCPVGGATVPERSLGSLAPWMALVALVGAGAAVGLVWKRRNG